jgi:hypothetical protein
MDQVNRTFAESASPEMGEGVFCNPLILRQRRKDWNAAEAAHPARIAKASDKAA